MIEEARRALRESDSVLMDWDGCCAIENRVLPVAAQFIARHQNRVAIVSNNSSNVPADFAQRLARRGVRFPPQRVVLAGVEAIAAARTARGARVQVLGDRKLRAYARREGLRLTSRDPDIIILLRDTSFTYAVLEKTANALLAGARLIVANPDRTHPGRHGRVIPETGALLAALGACVDLSAIDMEVIGKPSAHLFQRAGAILGAQPERMVMIGDNRETDIKGAAELGMATILVGGGADAVPVDQLFSLTA